MFQIAVPANTLASPSGGAIRIDTRQVETLSTRDINTETNEAVCTVEPVVANVREDSPG